MSRLMTAQRYAVVVAWFFCVGPVAGQQAGTDRSAGLSAAAEAFVKEAQQGSKGEIALGQMAADKAQSDAVKEFGQRMVEDHSKANRELMEIAARDDLVLDNELSREHQQIRDKLADLSGAEFDKAYIAAMVEDHRKDISNFETATRSVPDQSVVEFARETLPVLRDHLQHAENLKDRFGAPGSPRAMQ